MSRLILLKVEPGAVVWKCCVHSDYSLFLSPSVYVCVLYTAHIHRFLWRFAAIRNTEYFHVRERL